MQLAQRIRQARRKEKLSQKALAGLVGVQRSAVSNWESANSVQPAMATMISIAKAASVSLEWLATGQGNMEPGHESRLEVPAVDIEFTDTPYERDLLRSFRRMSDRAQILFLDLADEFVSTRNLRRGPKKL